MRHAVTGIRKLTPAQTQIVVDTMLGLYEEVAADPEAELTSGAQEGVDSVSVLAGADAFPLVRLTVPEGCPCNDDLIALGEIKGWEIYRVPWAGSKSATFLKRNVVTVSFAHVLHAFPATLVPILRSGTWSTIRRAIEQGIEIRYYPLDGSPPKIRSATSGRLFT